MLFSFLILSVTQHLKETKDFVTPKMNVPTWVDELLDFAPKDLESVVCVIKNRTYLLIVLQKLCFKKKYSAKLTILLSVEYKCPGSSER